jgi:hypothetical protein
MIALELGSGGQDKEKNAAPKCELYIPMYCEKSFCLRMRSLIHVVC